MTPQAGIAETPAGAGEDHILPCPACSSQLALPAAALVIHPLLRLLLCAKDRTGYFSSQYGPQLKADNNPAFEKMLAGLSLPCTEGSCSSPRGPLLISGSTRGCHHLQGGHVLCTASGSRGQRSCSAPTTQGSSVTRQPHPQHH